MADAFLGFGNTFQQPDRLKENLADKPWVERSKERPTREDADDRAHISDVVLIFKLRSPSGKQVRHRHCLVLPRYVSSTLSLSLRSFPLRNAYRSDANQFDEAGLIELVTNFGYRCHWVKNMLLQLHYVSTGNYEPNSRSMHY